MRIGRRIRRIGREIGKGARYAATPAIEIGRGLEKFGDALENVGDSVQSLWGPGETGGGGPPLDMESVQDMSMTERRKRRAGGTRTLFAGTSMLGSLGGASLGSLLSGRRE